MAEILNKNESVILDFYSSYIGNVPEYTSNYVKIVDPTL